MKILTLLLASLVSLALFPGPASANPLPPSMSAARNAARAVGWEVARRNDLVHSVKVDGCTKKPGDRFHCLVLDRGSTSNFKTICRVSVRVEVVNGRSRGTLRGVNCDRERLLLFRAADAEAAMQRRVQELASHPERVSIMLTRISRVEIIGNAAWAEPEGELCAARLQASLTGDGLVVISVEQSHCTKVSSLTK
jgi:hypothetical protein